MKILHFVEEFSKKNSSVITVARYYSKIDKIDKKKGLLFCLKKINYVNYFFLLKKNNINIVHFHGMWRINQLIFCFIAQFLDVKIIIQPHGMLLSQAVNKGLNIKYLFKILIIFFYKLLINKIYFIGVTKEEIKSIKFYFKNYSSILIKNPFKTNYYLSKKIKKNICFFGRINKHKNLKLIILSFIKANIDKDWKFMIYGIEDDKKYFNEIFFQL